ncbi:MAG: HD-GYP domain-containing protein [Gemmataceae bacterium]
MAEAKATDHHVLVVDDHRTNALLLKQILLGEGHHVAIAHDGIEALRQLESRRPDLILLDLDMPKLDGYEVCRRIKKDSHTSLIPIIIITAQTAFEAKMRAWELGADDFITKPFQCLELVARCRSLLRIKRLVDERDTAEAVVFAFARAVEAKSPYTHGHSERVAAFALALAQRVGLRDKECETLRMGALLHDIGKISIPDAILDKPDVLTSSEFAIMKQHTIEGTRIVEPLCSVRDAVPMIRWHHERMDGGGYPDGLFASAIPLPVRILAVADVFDSLSSQRPYRGAIPCQQCLQILQRDAATGGLDPELVAIFGEVLANGIAAIIQPPITNAGCASARPGRASTSVNGTPAVCVECGAVLSSEACQNCSFAGEACSARHKTVSALDHQLDDPVQNAFRYGAH